VLLTSLSPFWVSCSPINHQGQVAHYDRHTDGVSQIAYPCGNSLEDRLFQIIQLTNLIPNKTWWMFIRRSCAVVRGWWCRCCSSYYWQVHRCLFWHQMTWFLRMLDVTPGIASPLSGLEPWPHLPCPPARHTPQACGCNLQEEWRIDDFSSHSFCTSLFICKRFVW
jgi:hypothetical protein